MKEEKYWVKTPCEYETAMILEQVELQKRISCISLRQLDEIELIGGIDLAYWKAGETEYAVCCIVVINRKTLEVIESKHLSDQIDIPYIPGLLSFRELPLILETLKLVENKMDLLIFDGNGYLHPRHMGIATHAGIILGIPTIGIAKSYYMIENAEFTMPMNEPGNFSDIMIHGEVYGRALRTMKNVKPVYLSVGNHISLEDATKLAMELVSKESHIPVPTRLADIETHKRREDLRN